MSEEIQKNSDDRIYRFLQPISGASILGLFAFAGAAFVFGSRYTGWIGDRDIGMVSAATEMGCPPHFTAPGAHSGSVSVL